MTIYLLLLTSLMTINHQDLWYLSSLTNILAKYFFIPFPFLIRFFKNTFNALPISTHLSRVNYQLTFNNRSKYEKIRSKDYPCLPNDGLPEVRGCKYLLDELVGNDVWISQSDVIHLQLLNEKQLLRLSLDRCVFAFDKLYPFFLIALYYRLV